MKALIDWLFQVRIGLLSIALHDAERQIDRACDRCTRIENRRAELKRRHAMHQITR